MGNQGSIFDKEKHINSLKKILESIEDTENNKTLIERIKHRILEIKRL